MNTIKNIENTTYFLGAGASIQCLPVYKKRPKSFEIRPGLIPPIDLDISCFDECLKYFIDRHHNDFFIKYDLNIEYLPDTIRNIVGFNFYSDAIQILIKYLTLIKKELDYHLSVDTLAKKLWHTKAEKPLSLDHLKAAISAFFCLLQIENPPDMRYDSLIATIIDRENKLPSNYKIIAWNYDLQLELAAKNYFPKANAEELHKILQGYPYLRKGNPSYQFDITKFGIVNLNSKAGLFSDAEDIELYFDITETNKIEQIKSVLRNFLISINTAEAMQYTFCFAWETESDLAEQSIKNAVTILDSTKQLIIIGYSFPNFNREVDLKLLSSFFKNNIPGKKLIIQSPEAEKFYSFFERNYFEYIDKSNQTRTRVIIEIEKNINQFVTI